MTKQQLELFVEEDFPNGKHEEIRKPFKRKYVPGKDFWKPHYAYEVREWLTEYWEARNIPFPNNFSHMKARQLYAIYNSIRIRDMEKLEQARKRY
ncbi:hypothetical protein HZA33_02090 [Candidatus Pacearchaeota archaeon]|nr:hypothetical protein [Candidatus Pacearchaeota archaeon]